MTEICFGCGQDREVVDAGPGWCMYRCPLCGLSREEVTE